MKKIILFSIIITVGILLGLLFLSLDKNATNIDVINNVELVFSQDVFEYGEGTIRIPIYKYITNTEDFYSIKSDPVTLSNKAIGKHEVVFTVIPKNKKSEITIIKTIEIKDTQPAKIYPNNYWVNSDYCGQVLASVMDPVDGLLDYKEDLSSSDYGYYTVYCNIDNRIIKAIDKNGNVSELIIDNYTGQSEGTTTLSEDIPIYNNGCEFASGFDGIHYMTQEQAIDAARSYFEAYQAQSNPPKSFNVSITQCNDTTYYIWDFIW